MFCFRKAIIIFSVLILSDQMKFDAIIYGQNDDCYGRLTSSSEDRLKNFQTFVKNHLETGFVPIGSASIRPNSLVRLPEISEKFLSPCLGIFENTMKNNELTYTSKNAEDLAKLGRLAFETLDKKCKDIFANIQTLISGEVLESSAEANAILLEKDVLDFLAFLNDPEISPVDMEAEIKRLKKAFKNSIHEFEDNELTIVILLHKYNLGDIREDYPKLVGNIKRKLIKACTKF